jgi:hypothetical protein
LRNFSFDRKKKTINVFNLADNSFDLVDDPNVDEKLIAIKNRFQKEFFYDTDNVIENFLESNIETPASKVIQSIVDKNNLDLSSEERSKLFCFVSSLLNRTPEALKQADSMLNSNLNQIVRELLRLNNLDEDVAEEGRFVFDDKHLISMSALDGAAKHLALNDLELALVFNKSSTDFYISDHPVFSYNWFYRKSSHPEITSIFAKGLQIFLPLSYNLTLCLYDPIIYKYGRRNKKIIEIENPSDVDILNSFQISNADFHIGFRSPSSLSNLKQLYKRYGARKIHKWETCIISRHEDSDIQKRTRTLTVRSQLELKRMPSFVHTRKASKKDNDVVSLRNPLLAQAYYELDRESADRMRELKNSNIDVNDLREQIKAKLLSG